MEYTMTKAASETLSHAAKEQDMTPTERRETYVAAQRKCRERKGTYVSIADVENATWEIVGGRWK